MITKLMSFVLIVTIFIFLLLIMLMNTSGAQVTEDGDYIRPDYLRKDQQIIYDNNGQRKGIIRKDYFRTDQVIIYDNNGRRTGVLRKDYLFSDRSTFIKER